MSIFSRLLCVDRVLVYRMYILVLNININTYTQNNITAPWTITTRLKMEFQME